MENWKDVLGYEGMYQVSDYGNIKSLSRIIRCGPKGKRKILTIIMKLGECNDYKVVWFKKLNVNKKFKVHRLVAEVFIPNPEKKPIVNHKDRNRINNLISNLEWVTDSENMNHWRKDNK